MKPLHLLALLLALSLPASSFAAKGAKAGKGAAKPGKALRAYDTNGNGQIDGAEIEAVRKAFEAEKEGPLKSLDKDSDGKLSDEEITSAKMKAKGKGKKTA